MKDTCASCGQKIYNSEARYALKGNYCDRCNALASKTAHDRQYKENYRHLPESNIIKDTVTMKDVIKLRKRFTEELDFPAGKP